METQRTFSKESGAKYGLEKKQKFIGETVKRKENSITEAAIRRDSAMFASVSAKHESRESLKEELEYWTEFFSNRYAQQEQKEVEEKITLGYGEN